MGAGSIGIWKTIVVAGLLGAAGVVATSGCLRSRAAHDNDEFAPPVKASREGAFARLQLDGEQPMDTVKNQPPIRHASEADFDDHVLRSPVPVLVDFYADWCGPCKRLAPLLEELAAENRGVRVVKVNVDSSPDLAARYHVEAIPTLKVFKNGKLTGQIAGLASKSQLRELVAQ